MKKYVKPDVYYENFELSQHVATCFWDMPNNSDADNCTATSTAGTTIFANDNCTFYVSKQDVEAYCWTNGSIDSRIFNS